MGRPRRASLGLWLAIAVCWEQALVIRQGLGWAFTAHAGHTLRTSSAILAPGRLLQQQPPSRPRLHRGPRGSHSPAAEARLEPRERATIFGHAPHDFVRVRKALRVSANVIPALVLAALLLPSLPKWALVGLVPVVGLVAEAVASGRAYCKNIYVFAILPLYYLSILLLPLLPLQSWGSRLTVLGLAVALGAVRMGIMTVCLHRYAAHAAFRCNSVVNLALGLLGCLANQGGPLWWASKHRCHHKFCDGPEDPHSPVVRSPEEAFSFFTEARHEPIDERFTPRHCDTPGMRFIDAFSSLPLILEHCAAYYCFGVVGLWVAHVSAWMCQSGTLWFNVISHAAPTTTTAAVEGCRASDNFAWRLPSPLFLPLQILVMGIFPFIGEKTHQHHHNHPGLARRPGLDLPYFLFVWPLQRLGLVRGCIVKTKEVVAV